MPDDVFTTLRIIGEAIILPSAAYIGKRFNDRIDRIERDSHSFHQSLDDHKLNCEKTYSTKAEVNNAMANINALFLEVRNDIKTLLSRK